MHVGAGGTGIRLDVTPPVRPAPSTLPSYRGEPRFVGRIAERARIEAVLGEGPRGEVVVRAEDLVNARAYARAHADEIERDIQENESA
jgi:hypothetical protein